MPKNSSTLSSEYLLKRLAILLLLALFCTQVIARLIPPDSAASDRTYAKKREMFLAQKDHLEAISVGNSHGIGIHFDTLGLDGMHFFQTGVDVEEAIEKAMHISVMAPSLKYVFMTLSPGALQFSNRYLEADYLKRRMRLLRDMPDANLLWHLGPEDAVTAFVHRAFPVEAIQNTFYRHFGYANAEVFVDEETRNRCVIYLSTATPSSEGYVRYEDGIVGGYRHSLIQPVCIEPMAKRNAARSKKRVVDTLAKKPDILDKNIERLLHMANALQANNIRLILVDPPTTTPYYRSSQLTEFVPAFEKSIQTLGKHENITFFDFHDLYEEHLSMGKNDVFYDDNHLAFPGSIAFSRVLKNALTATQ